MHCVSSIHKIINFPEKSTRWLTFIEQQQKAMAMHENKRDKRQSQRRNEEEKNTSGILWERDFLSTQSNEKKKSLGKIIITSFHWVISLVVCRSPFFLSIRIGIVGFCCWFWFEICVLELSCACVFVFLARCFFFFVSITLCVFLGHSCSSSSKSNSNVINWRKSIN